MLTNQIGYYSIILGLIFSVLIFITSLKDLKNIKILNKKIFFLSFFQFFFVLLSFIALIFLFISSDFGNEIVFSNSHSTKPIFYKIAGAWGNHEGSLLLWLLVLTLFIFLFLLNSKNQPIKYRILTLVYQQIIIIGFFLFILLTSSPFNYLYPAPAEGLGLNPILQDPALAIHPPILYLGYVGSSIIFSASLAATTQNYISKAWAKNIKIWILISWIFLTIGILVGSIWAYYELGWGGFWFWDPVENVSLMPWLCLTALLHCVLVLEKKSLLSSWIIILSISTFILSVSGTFLVRSGVLNSVHTFANDPSRGIFILVFLFILILFSLIIFFFFKKENKDEKIKIFWLSKNTFILINNWFMMYFLSVVLIGTIYPIFLEVLSNDKISIGPPFYHKLIIPVLIPFLILMSFSQSLSWFKSKIDKINVKLILVFIISIILSFSIAKIAGSKNLYNSILVSASLYLFLVSIKDFFNRYKSYAQSISHFGFSLLILSILLNGILSTEVTANLKVGEKFIYKEGSIEFSSIKSYQKNNFKSIVGLFKIEDKKKNYVELEPELRIYNQPITITSEADIKTTIYADRFLVMNKVKGDDYFNVRYQVKPFMIWIWISTFLLAFGGSLSLFRRLNEK